MAPCARLALVTLGAAAAARHTKLTILVSRHGIRTPYPPIDDGQFGGNLTAEAIARITDQDFPACWPPGPKTSDVWGTDGTAELTPRGSEVITNMGIWQRKVSFPDVNCSDVALYSDTASRRDNATAVSWAAGAFPSCSFVEEDILDVQYDVDLFNQGGDTTLCDFPAKLVIDTYLGNPDSGYASLREANAARLAKIDEVVRCCPPSVCGDLPNCTMSTMPIEYNGVYYSVTDGAVNQGAYWASFFLFEYLNGNERYALGRLSEADIIDLYRLAVENIEYADNPVSAPNFASDLAAHIAAAIHQAAAGEAVEGVAHDPSAKVVYMAGHDLNLALLRQLLGLYWQPAGWGPNTLGPGAVLGFELSVEEDEDRVSAFFQIPSPRQQREGRRFSEDDPLDRVPVALPGCSTASHLDCTVADFVKLVAKRVNNACIVNQGLRRFIDRVLRPPVELV